MKFKRNDNFLLKEVAGDHILIARGAASIDFSSVVLFNETGVFLWEHMEQLQTPEELAGLLISEFDAPSDAALQDVNAFLEKMNGEGLVVQEGD